MMSAVGCMALVKFDLDNWPSFTPMVLPSVKARL